MHQTPIKGKLLALAAVMALAAACVAGLPLYIQFQQYAERLSEDARTRLTVLWGAEAQRLSQRADAVAGHSALNDLDPTGFPHKEGLALAYEEAFGVTADAPEILAVVSNRNTTVFPPEGDTALDSFPQIQAARQGISDAGFTLIGNQLYELAATPLLNNDGATAPADVLVIGRRVSDYHIRQWEQVVGGRLQFVRPHAAPAPTIANLRLGEMFETVLRPANTAWSIEATDILVRFQPRMRIENLIERFGWLFAASASMVLLLTMLALRIGGGIVRAGRSAAPPPPARPAALPEPPREDSKELARLRTLLDGAVEPTLLFDRHGRVTAASERLRILLGSHKNDPVGHDIVSLIPDRSGLRKQAYHHFMQALEGRRNVFETLFATATGGVRPVEVSIGLVDTDPDPTVQAIVRDIGERKRREAHTLHSAMQSGVNSLAGGIAHDFTHIVGGILGYASLIKGQVGENDRIRRYVDVIERSASRASELTERLAGYARGESGEAVPLNPDPFLEELAASISGGLKKSGILIDTRKSTNPRLVAVDAPQLRQALASLCAAAREAMPDGGRIRLINETVTVHPGASVNGLSPGTYVCVTVADTGSGMAAETRQRMFSPPPNDTQDGSLDHPAGGLDPAIVRAFLQSHGGRITVSSRPGRGTAVRLYLPALEMFEAEAETDLTLPANTTTILVVDSDPRTRTDAKKALEESGYGAVLARDAAEALHIYERYGEAIALVVLDASLPEPGARALFKELSDKNPAVRVVISSAFSRHGQAYDLLEMGAVGFVQKPFRPGPVGDAVKGSLSTSKTAPAGDF
ncbi:MAG: ATP-binding protein [Leptospirillia bacterium]